jgi:hypothetical protein
MSSINVLSLAIGVVLLVLVVVDLLWTTLWADGGAGPLSARLSAWAWSGLRIVASDRSRLLSIAGPAVLVLTLAAWVGLLWAGWTFVFAGSDTSLIDTSGGGPITWVERIYFVAYSMFTMGNGGYSPNGAAWQIATSLTTASGMLFVTLGVSYVLSVLGAVVDKRSFASTVTGIGTRGETIVRDAWDGEDLHELDLPLDTLGSEVSRLAQQHQAYPILHYYHSEDEGDASALAVAIFDEALTLLRFGVPEEHRPNEPLVDTARENTEGYIQTLSSKSIQPAEEPPPPPDLDRLRDAGVPTVSDEDFAARLDELTERRRKMRGVVTADAWRWPTVNDE